MTRCILVAILLSLSSQVWAATWNNHPAEPLVRTLKDAHSVTLAPHSQWTLHEVEDVLAATRALPKTLRGGPITIARRKKYCLRGVGRYNKACPTFSKDGHTFFLYDVPPVQGDGATRTLGPLSAQERTRLQHQRAIVHMFLSRFDRKHAWSKRRRWSEINSWSDDGTASFNVDDWAFSRFLGKRSRHLDFVTFAEEFFIRPEDILRTSGEKGAAERLKALDPNISVACQYFTKSRVLKNFIAASDPTWTPPARGVTGRRATGLGYVRGQCPQFELWADIDRVESIDILLAAATSDRPESLYGHLLFQVRYKQGSVVRSRGFEPVYQYGAVTDTNVDKLEYFSKGLFGGFYSVMQPNTFRGIDRLFMQYEQRTLRRYTFNLSPRERLWFMQRIWEAERHITYKYFFLSDNCASMLLDLFAPALDTPLPKVTRFALMPTEVLDVFASASGGDRGPLLVKRAETHFSSREVALNSVGLRRKALDVLLRRLNGTSEKDKAALRGIDARLDKRDPATRKKAYEELLRRLRDALTTHKNAQPDTPMTGDGAITRDAIDYLYHSSRIERYFMDLAFYARRMIHASAQQKPLILTAREQLEMRRQLFKIEDLAKRQEAMFKWAQSTDARLRDGKKRPFTPEETQQLASIERTRDAYLASLEALASIIDAFEPDLDGVAYMDAKLQRFEAEQTRRDALSMGPAGKGRVVVGAAVASVGDTTTTPTAWVDLEASLIYERLGEQRRRGFRSDIESRALGLDAELEIGPKLVERLKLDATLFRFLSIEQRPGPVRKSWLDNFGWGIDLGALHDGRRGVDFGLRGQFGYTYPVWTHDNVSSFLVAGLFLDTRGEWSQSGGIGLGGLQAWLMGQWHLYGRYANVARFQVATTHHTRLHELRHAFDVEATLQTEHILADINQQLLLMRPYLKGEWTNRAYRPDQETFTSWRAGIALELPW